MSKKEKENEERSLKETNLKNNNNNNNNNNNKRKTEIEKELWNRLSELNKEFKDIREHKKNRQKKH